jgi:hypothetical protein
MHVTKSSVNRIGYNLILLVTCQVILWGHSDWVEGRFWFVMITTYVWGVLVGKRFFRRRPFRMSTAELKVRLAVLRQREEDIRVMEQNVAQAAARVREEIEDFRSDLEDMTPAINSRR